MNNMPFNNNKETDMTENLLDGRLSEPANNELYSIREMLKVVKIIGRPLTEEESRKYRIGQYKE